MIEDHLILLQFIFCYFRTTQYIEVKLVVFVDQTRNSDRANSTGGETFCFRLLVSLVMSSLCPYLHVPCYVAQGFACSLLHAYYYV